MKNLYITGGLGQDGRILSKIISKKKFKIFVLSKKLPLKNISGIKLIKSNLKNKKKILEIFKKNKPDIILHLAANNPAYNEKGFKKFYSDNLNYSLNIFNASYLINKNIKFSNWKGDENKIQIRNDGYKQIFFQDPQGYWIEVNNIN